MKYGLATYLEAGRGPQNTINFIPNPHAGGTVVGARADPDMTHPFLRLPGRSLALVGQDMKRALVQGR